mgnify:CR=1 FL=1
MLFRSWFLDDVRVDVGRVTINATTDDQLAQFATVATGASPITGLFSAGRALQGRSGVAGAALAVVTQSASNPADTTLAFLNSVALYAANGRATPASAGVSLTLAVQTAENVTSSRPLVVRPISGAVAGGPDDLVISTPTRSFIVTGGSQLASGNVDSLTQKIGRAHV